jgi:Bifunctional DNA primase/polymerase, N-terminal
MLVTPDFRLGAVDVDDNSLVQVVKLTLGACPCAKRGKKGITYFIRVPKSSRVKSCKITNHAKIGVVDVLIGGRMTVLPPTNHPETNKPYVWIGSPLLDTDINDLPIVDDQKLALLKLVIGSEEAAILCTGEATHEAGLRLVAKLVRHGSDDATIANVFQGLLPTGYKGNSLDELPEWIASAREKGFGEPTTEKQIKSAADRLCGYFDRSGATLFHDEAKRGYMSVLFGTDGIRHIALHSSEGRMWLTKLIFDAEGKALSTKALDEAINLLEARARFASAMYRTHLRLGGGKCRVVIDLGQDDGRQVIIKAGGWVIGVEREEKLIRSPGFGALPIPTRDGSLDALKRLLGLADEAWILVLAFLLACLQPAGPYMLLLVEGEQGSGKSFFCKLLKRIIDPNQVEKARLPESERDLMIHAKDYFLLSFDNVSGMKGDLSDALCVLATGGGFATRKLYSDDELFVFDYTRPIMINGIADFANRPDLLERAIPLKLPAINEGCRKTEGQMLVEFTECLPGILGRLYDIVGAALATIPKVTARNKLRMADTGRWLMACEPHTGLARGSFIKALLKAQDDVFVERAQSDVVVGKLLNLVDKEPFECTVQELFDHIAPGYKEPTKNFPATPQHLSKHLARLKPAMAKAGLHFTWLAKTRKGRRIRIWQTGQENRPAAVPVKYPRY